MSVHEGMCVNHQHKRSQHNNNIVCVCVIMHACEYRECVCKHAYTRVLFMCIIVHVCLHKTAVFMMLRLYWIGRERKFHVSLILNSLKLSEEPQHLFLLKMLYIVSCSNFQCT